jgi:hypothetical protein
MVESDTISSSAQPRFFKTSWFAKTAQKSSIVDGELCKAAYQIAKGQADDLGGGVIKKRLNKNLYRAIVFGKGGKYWIYVFLYAKKNRENIDDHELKAFRELAELYAQKTDVEINKEVEAKELVEICR